MYSDEKLVSAREAEMLQEAFQQKENFCKRKEIKECAASCALAAAYDYYARRERIPEKRKVYEQLRDDTQEQDIKADRLYQNSTLKTELLLLKNILDAGGPAAYKKVHNRLDLLVCLL